MKKEEPKYLVTYKATKDNIKSIGSNRWLKTQTAILYTFMGLFLLLAVIVMFLDNGQTREWGWIIIVPVIFWFIWFYGNIIYHGNKFWDKVKDKQEPINLDEVE